jgi:hypothetical protein
MRARSLGQQPATTTPLRLFIASCIALVATAMSFAIRGDIMRDFERLFALSNSASQNWTWRSPSGLPGRRWQA